MAALSEDDIEFARQHIVRYYDTDFFPKHFAIQAIWHNWEEAKKFLVGRPIREIPLLTPNIVTWPKPRGGYRIVHQPDPLSSLVYAAVAHHVGTAIEHSRAPVGAAIACSYRIALSDGSFFDEGTGWPTYRTKTEELCKKFSHILVTDITDFYNQIYVHRVRNAIATADAKLEDHGKDIEELLMHWNSRTSQGIPVGPAASIIMSEALLIDVDRFLQNKGVEHTRYVDDFRIFANSEKQLRSTLRDLTAYIYEIHRLNLSGEKTKLSTTQAFVDNTLHNQYELEKIEIFETTEEVVNPYTQEVEDVIYSAEGREAAIQTLKELFARVLALPYGDLGLSRAVMRKAKGLEVADLIPMIFENITKLLPVINDVFLYIAHVELPLPSGDLVAAMEAVTVLEVAQEPAFRVWAEWLLTSSPIFMKSAALKQYVVEGQNPLSLAKIAVIEKNIAWVREHRARYAEQTILGKLAAIYASPILAKDERIPWLRAIMRAASGATMMERWFAKTALDGEIDHTFAEEAEAAF